MKGRHLHQCCSILQKTSITTKILKSKFSSLKHEQTSIAVNLGVNFMIKRRSAVKHRPLQASEFFNTETYGVSVCFAVNHTDTMYHGTRSSIQDRFQRYELPNYNENDHIALIIEASPLPYKLSSISAETFHIFAVAFYQHFNQLAEGFQGLDVVFDQYFSNIFESQTRMDWGAGGRYSCASF